MKKNVFTKNIQFLIISLLILAIIIPKENSHKSMGIVLCLWLIINAGVWLWNYKDLRSKKDLLNFILKHPVKSKKTEATNPSIPSESEEGTIPKKTPFTLTNEEVESIFLHLSLRITEKLKSAYPKVVWQWKEKPSLQALLSGSTVRILVENMNKYTHADLNFDRFGRIHVEPLTIGTFSPDSEADVETEDDVKSEPDVVDVKAWYELIGQRILETQITELNAGGHSKLTIKENGDIVINRNKKEVYVSSLEAFPAKNYWDELITILKDNELHAKIVDNKLQVSWI